MVKQRKIIGTKTMISNSKYGNAKKQELNFLEILEKWTSKVDKCQIGRAHV